MSLRIRYAPLLRLHVQHDALLDLGSRELASLSEELQQQRLNNYDLSAFLAIEPTPDCWYLMARHRLRFRQEKNGIVIYAEVTEDNKLSHPLDDNAVFRLYLNPANLAFASAANLALDGSTNDAYYFSNSHEHEEAGELHLTQEIPAFSASDNYLAGDLVIHNNVLLEAVSDLAPSATPAAADWLSLPAPVYHNGDTYQLGGLVLHSGKVYESNSEGAHPTPQANSANWKTIYTPQLRTGVTSADRTTLSSPQISIPISETITFAKVQLLKPDDTLVTSRALFHDTGEELAAINLSLDQTPKGFYRLEARDSNDTMLAGFPLHFYLETEPAQKTTFGLIELFHQVGTHAMLNPDGTLLSPTFHIRFRKRHTYWRYSFHGDLKSLPPSELGDLAQEDVADVSRYASTVPLPLTSGAVTLKRFGDSLFLPNPELTSVARDGAKLYSEMFIHL